MVSAAVRELAWVSCMLMSAQHPHWRVEDQDWRDPIPKVHLPTSIFVGRSDGFRDPEAVVMTDSKGLYDNLAAE